MESDPERKMYKLAARNLREYNGVPSMTPAKLAATLAFLKLTARRLVKQGLAPKGLLARMSADSADNTTAGSTTAAPAETSIAEAGTPSPPDASAVDSGAAAKDAKKQKNVLHEAFLAGGIRLRSREVRPLLLALDVRAGRLVRLGYVDPKDLSAMLQAEKASHKRDGDDHGHRQQMARGGGPADSTGPDPTRQRSRAARGLRGGASGAPGARRSGNKVCHPGTGSMSGLVDTNSRKPCGRKMAMRRHQHPVARLPPPPSARADAGEGKGGNVSAPANSRAVSGGAPRGASQRGSRAHSCRFHAKGAEEGEGGVGFRRGGPYGMVRMRRARSVPQQQHENYFWG